MDIKDAWYLGLYEHFYDDSIFTDEPKNTDEPNNNGAKVSTHYVVNGFEVVLPESHVNLPCEQHNEYRWLSEKEFKPMKSCMFTVVDVSTQSWGFYRRSPSNGRCVSRILHGFIARRTRSYCLVFKEF